MVTAVNGNDSNRLSVGRAQGWWAGGEGEPEVGVEAAFVGLAQLCIGRVGFPGEAVGEGRRLSQHTVPLPFIFSCTLFYPFQFSCI